jgi:hypothetical protein
MTSSTDFQKLWFLYKTEEAPNGISINDFCLSRGVTYSEFEKWYKKNMQSIAEVQVENSPEIHSTVSPEKETPHPMVKHNAKRGNIHVVIKTLDGLQVIKGGLDYARLYLQPFPDYRTAAGVLLLQLQKRCISTHPKRSYPFTFEWSHTLKFDKNKLFSKKIFVFCCKIKSFCNFAADCYKPTPCSV